MPQHEYMEKHKTVDGVTYEVPDSMTFCVPFSLRQPFKSIEEAKMTNDLVSLFVKLPMHKDFKTALKAIHDHYEGLKNSLEIFGVFENFKIIV